MGKEVMCRKCKISADSEVMYKRESKSTGIYYVCEKCGDITHEAYKSVNVQLSNDKKEVEYIVSIEFQVSNQCDYGAWDTLRDEYGWQIIYDQLGYIEYKTPHYTSLNSLPKALDSISKIIMIDSWNKEVDYATYVYVGHKRMAKEDLNIIYKYYIELFKPLLFYLKQNKAVAKNIYGTEVELDSHDIEILNQRFIDVLSSPSLVFKFIKYISASQFMNVIQLSIKMMDCININFLNHFHSDSYDRRRYESLDAFRQHKAMLTANKLVGLVTKNSNDIQVK